MRIECVGENVDVDAKISAVIYRKFTVDSVAYTDKADTKPNTRMDLDWSVKRTHNLSTTVAAMPALTFDQLIDKASVSDMLTPGVLTQLRAYVLRKRAQEGGSGDLGIGGGRSAYWTNKLEIVDALLGQ